MSGETKPVGPNLTPADPDEAYVVDPNTGELVLRYPYLNTDGAEVLDPTPMAPPLGYNPQPSIFDQVRMMILSDKLRQAAEESGMETFEEADDFEVGDDFDPHSPWENDFDPPIKEIVEEVKRLKAKGVKVPDDAEESVEYLADQEPVRQDPPPKAKPKKAPKEPEPEQE